MNLYFAHPCSTDSSVGIGTGYGLNGPGIESRWGRIFPHLSRPALRPTQPPVQWVPGLSRGGVKRPGRDADPSPLLVPWSWISRAIPLLPLWAVRPVQSLSACTRVHFAHPCSRSFGDPHDIQQISVRYCQMSVPKISAFTLLSVCWKIYPAS